MRDVPPELHGHPDRLRWNDKYRKATGGTGPGAAGASFAVHPLAAEALSVPPPAGPVLDLACGASGAALLAAESGRAVTAVDVSEVALDLLAHEARRRGPRGSVTLVQADLARWRPAPGHYALVLCTGYWDRALFAAAAQAVAPGGVLAWEAFTTEARAAGRDLPPEWCLSPGEPATLLPAGFTVLDQHDPPGPRRGAKRRLLAHRTGPRRA